MWWLIVTAVGFLVVTAVVMGLARGSTAEWEREKRAARAPRREAATVSPPPAGATRLLHASVRTAAAAPRVARALAASVKQGLGDLTPPKRLLPSATPLRRALGTLGSKMPGAVIRRWKQATTAIRELPDGEERGGAGGVVSRQPGHRHRTRRRSRTLRRRRRFRLPHRPHRSRAAASRSDPDQRPADMTTGAPAQGEAGPT